jgi:hypothetical protein
MIRLIKESDWTITEVVSTESDLHSDNPSLGVDSDGTVHVIWYDKTDYNGSGSGIKLFYKYKPKSGSWSDTEVIGPVGTSTFSDEITPSLAIDGDDTVHVAWVDLTGYGGSGDDVDIAYSNKPKGQSWSDREFASIGSTLTSYEQSLAVEPDGTVHVSWMDERGWELERYLLYNFRTNDGIWSEVEVIVPKDRSRHWSSISVDSEGTAHVVYSEGGGHIFYRYKPKGGSWSQRERVDTESDTWSRDPDIAIDDNDTIHVAWDEFVPYRPSCIYYKNKRVNADWTSWEEVNLDTWGNCGHPSLDCDNDGTFHIAWADSSGYNESGGDWDIFYKYRRFGIYNYPPDKPTITGKQYGNNGTEYEYTFTSSDPDGDLVSYYIDWGDGKKSDWSTFKQSGKPYSKSHTWTERGTYTVQAKARDLDGAQSDWGKLTVTIPRDKTITEYILLLRILERFPLLWRVVSRLNVR